MFSNERWSHYIKKIISILKYYIIISYGILYKILFDTFEIYFLCLQSRLLNQILAALNLA